MAKKRFLTPDERDILIDRVRQFFWEEREDELGELAADSILEFFMEQLGPIIAGKVLKQYKERMQLKLEDCEAEVTGNINYRR